jgi:predicted outer membrane repeat protein
LLVVATPGGAALPSALSGFPDLHCLASPEMSYFVESNLMMEYIMSLRLILLCLLATFIALPALAATSHVPADQPTIQDGIDACAEGDSVLVSPGTYTGVGNKDLDFGGKDLVLIGTGGAKQTVIDCEGQGRGMIFSNGESPASVVQGFTIRNGYLEEGGGAGIRCFSDVTFRDLILEDNEAANTGGIVILGGSPSLEDVIIRGNTGQYETGGLFIGSGSFATLTDVLITENIGDYGGGIGMWGASVHFERVEISYNTASHFGGGVYSSNDSSVYIDCRFIGNNCPKGGGMYLSVGSIDMQDCLFKDNVAAFYGGAIYVRMDVFSTLERVEFYNNTASTGGALCVSEYSETEGLQVTSSTFVGNQSTSYTGGAICADWQGKVHLENSLIALNTGGGLFTYYGGGIYPICCDVWGNMSVYF